MGKEGELIWERNLTVRFEIECQHIEAMGGELEIIAHFPDGNVRIEQFQMLDEPGSKTGTGA